MEMRQATWLELFFDLVFVALIGILTHKLGHLHSGHLDYKSLVQVILLFAPIWWVWSSFTIYANKYERDDRVHRIVHLMVMGLIISMSATIKTIEGVGFKYFAFLYFLTRLTLGILYFINKSNIGFNKAIAKSIFVGGGLSLVSIALPRPISYIVFLSGLVIEIVKHIHLSRHPFSSKIHRKHLAERVGLLTIILLGESVISIASTVGDMDWTGPAVVAGFMGFVILGLIWWIFYDSYHVFDYAKKFKNESYLIYPNFFLCLGLISLANLIKHSITGDMLIKDFQVLAVFGMSMFYIGKQIPYMYLFSSMRKGIVLNSVACIGITFISGFMPRVEFAIGTILVAMLFYVYSNMKWVIPKDWSVFLDKNEEDGQENGAL